MWGYSEEDIYRDKLSLSLLKVVENCCGGMKIVVPVLAILGVVWRLMHLPNAANKTRLLGAKPQSSLRP